MLVFFEGICVGDPLKVIVRKEFFIDLRLPYSAVRGEQIEIKAILHNYSPDLIDVSLCHWEPFCCRGFQQSLNQQKISVHKYCSFGGINYSSTLFKVRVTLIEEPNVCSSASKRGMFRQDVKVGPQSTRAVPFILIPMREGEVRVEVKAAVKDSSLNDGILKMLLVVVR